MREDSEESIEDSEGFEGKVNEILGAEAESSKNRGIGVWRMDTHNDSIMDVHQQVLAERMVQKGLNDSTLSEAQSSMGGKGKNLSTCYTRHIVNIC